MAVLCSAVLLAGCQTLSHQMLGTNSSGPGAPAPKIFGYAVADETLAAQAGRQVLDAGGNAADAAAAIGFALAVTLPSRAGLGGGGACVIDMPAPDGTTQPAVTLVFPPGAGADGGGRPAAVPSLARGLLALQARYGVLPAGDVITPAERLAAGAPVSAALASDLQIVGDALLADPGAAAIFGAPGGGVLPAGATLAQLDLVATLEQLRINGVQGFYAGNFAETFIQASDKAGGGLSQADFRAAAPQFGLPESFASGKASVAMLPLPASTRKALPASAGFLALDHNGGAVACAVTMNNLFGTGRVASGTGVLLAAAPRVGSGPVLAAAIATQNGQFRAAVTGTGQQGAAEAVTAGLQNALNNDPAAEVPEPGRANVISCPDGVAAGGAGCTANADPRGQGLALGPN
jgi:gamma-glutamyltranspeptidase/glutathione hydrolase